MGYNAFMGTILILCVSTLFFIVDISFNLRRVVRAIDRLWRKLTEINDSLQKKY